MVIGYSRILATGCLLLVLAVGSLAQASPIGTPVANRVPTGKGKNLGGLFDNLVDRPDGDGAPAYGGKPAKARKHLTAEEWRAAYIAKHGHDLPSLAHPGH
jgi:hypothetical protein